MTGIGDNQRFYYKIYGDVYVKELSKKSQFGNIFPLSTALSRNRKSEQVKIKE